VGRPIPEEERKTIGNQMELWCGRPGFFFDLFLPHFRMWTNPDLSLADRVDLASKDACNFFDSLFAQNLRSLQDKTIKYDSVWAAITGDEVVHFLYYCYRIRGGNIDCLSSALSDLVSTGFAIVRHYKADPQEESIGAIVEPLVHSFLSRTVQAPNCEAYAWCDSYIASRIKRSPGTSYGNAAGWAIANQIINMHGQPLRNLLNSWGFTSTVQNFLEDMTVRAEAAASVDDLLSRDPTGFIYTSTWSGEQTNPTLTNSVTIPRDGIVFPDAVFLASNQHNDYCLVTIQSKVTQDKLKDQDLTSAINKEHEYSQDVNPQWP